MWLELGRRVRLQTSAGQLDEPLSLHRKICTVSQGVRNRGPHARQITQPNVFCPQPGGWKPEAEVWQGRIPPPRSQGGSLLAPGIPGFGLHHPVGLRLHLAAPLCVPRAFLSQALSARVLEPGPGSLCAGPSPERHISSDSATPGPQAGLEQATPATSAVNS